METVFLVCFLSGLGLSVLTFILGAVHTGGHAPHLHLGHGASGGHGVHVHAAAHTVAGGPGSAPQEQASALNINTLLAAIFAFGGVGYLFTHALHWPAVLALGPAVAAAVAAGWVFWRYLMLLVRESRFLGPTQMVGALGRVSMAIRAGSTGEIVYTSNGSRHACGARSADGTAILQGSEVVVMRYENGIAYVETLRPQRP